MDGGGVGGVHSVVDPGGWWRVQERLVSRAIAELILEEAVDPVDGEVPAGTKYVKLAGQHQIAVKKQPALTGSGSGSPALVSALYIDCSLPGNQLSL